jgi:hypothetical protein
MNKKTIEQLFEGRWGGLHDAIVEVFNVAPTKEQAIDMFRKLPEEIQNLGREWGLSDTGFRDSSYRAIIDNGLVLGSNSCAGG